MSGWLNPRHPVYPWLGGLVLLGTMALSGWFLMQGPRPIQPEVNPKPFEGQGIGHYGTFRERLGDSTFLLNYDTIQGDATRLTLDKVQGRLEEPTVVWDMTSPQALRREEAWDLQGPMTFRATDPKTQRLLGQGAVSQDGPALRWEKGVWRGLKPLFWEDVSGSARGRWELPAGWFRNLDGQFVVTQGPVLWKALGEGAIRALETDRLQATLGLQDAHLEGVRAQVEGGGIQAHAAWVTPKEVRWEAPITFQRTDGWNGEASHGLAPRPAPQAPLDRLELQGLVARRPVTGGEERLASRGARWTRSGLRLEGSVTWDMPLEEQRLTLRAPRLVFRSEAGGTDLPDDLPVGHAWAEGQPVLTWGRRSLSSPRIEAHRQDRRWVVTAPSQGRSEQGSFTAGRGEGRPGSWKFLGPVQATLVDGSVLRGGQLAWEEDVWTLTGRPVTYTGLQERLSGAKLVRHRDRVAFPDGVSGAVSSQEGELTLRADRGERTKDGIVLEGRVEFRGAGWRLNADRVSVALGAGRTVRAVRAAGGVGLEGRLGEGRGAAMELDLVERRVSWEGRVRGSGEVRR